MTHVITQACCNDASCVPVCPVGCIHPEPGEPGFATAEMLYIDPATCIDCGACISACPVGAIAPDSQLPNKYLPYLELNAAYYADAPIASAIESRDLPPPLPDSSRGVLRVAIVGSGPAGSYAAEELLRHGNTDVTVFDRLPTPWGLVRAGVAPDHQSTKSVIDSFERTADNGAVRFRLNVEVGTDLSHEELMQHYHAVVYAYGASADRTLGIPGENLPGSIAAADFVHWYNGHPDYAAKSFDLSARRIAIIGNGNVALDVARMLVLEPEAVSVTDMALHAQTALRESDVEEVVVIGRRGPEDAAYTTPELMALGDLNGIDVLADETALTTSGNPLGSSVAHYKAFLAARYAANEPTTARRRIRLRFLASPVEILGEERVTGLRLERNRLQTSPTGEHRAVPTGEFEVLPVGMVIRSVGYRGRPIPGVPFDDDRGIVPNTEGRVISNGRPLPGTYVTGWVKRGPSGVIGTNRQCAQETVARLVEDFATGRLRDPVSSVSSMDELLRSRQTQVVDLSGWRSIDRVERDSGRAHGAPRRKLTDGTDLLAVANGGEGDRS